jgi:hypothetical protein
LLLWWPGFGVLESGTFLHQEDLGGDQAVGLTVHGRCDAR